MVSQVRARSEQAKEARRAEILEQTRVLWAQARYEDLTLQAVAQRVGLTKAALYGYFPTKESLFLSLYETLLVRFLDELQRHLRLGGRHTPDSLSALMVTLLGEHADLTRLIPHLASLLERNISEARAHDHKHWVLARLGPVSTSLEAALPGLPSGGGVGLLTYTQALVAGLYPMSDPAPAVGAALQDPALSALCVRLDTALPTALRALYTGLSITGPGTAGT
ncbi:TetR/AcrR family transcriptional regulator [Deinococcus navajonensis]|uniref:TetR/AcrR family transcriptional regulator n=1 Tax=Deinococcus navajonensis TaxID=309884 RepID=A0ABV8XGD8_9DEIO